MTRLGRAPRVSVVSERLTPHSLIPNCLASLCTNAHDTSTLHPLTVNAETDLDSLDPLPIRPLQQLYCLAMCRHKDKAPAFSTVFSLTHLLRPDPSS